MLKSRWARIFSGAIGIQAVIHALGFVSGILVVRLLSTEQYAFYTLSNVCLGAMNIIANTGLTSGVLTLIARSPDDSSRVSKIIGTSLYYRNRLAKLSLLLCAPLFLYLLIHHGASLTTTAAFLAPILATFYLTISGSILEIPLKVGGRYWELQRMQLFSSALRLALTGVALVLAPLGFIAVACSTASQTSLNLLMRRAQPKLTTQAISSPEIAPILSFFIARNVPGTFYYLFYGQIVLWIISFVGNTNAVAEVGALTRLSAAYNVVLAAISTTIVPRFATLPADSSRLRIRYAQVAVIPAGVCVIATLFTAVYPSIALSLLGHSYRSLHEAAFLAVLSGGLGLVFSVIYGMNSARGRLPPAWYYPITSALSVAVIASVADLHHTIGVLWFSVWASAASVAFGIAAYALFPEQGHDRSTHT